MFDDSIPACLLPPAEWKRSFPGRRARRPAPARTPLETCHLPSQMCSWSGCRSGRRWRRTEPGTPPEKRKGLVTALRKHRSHFSHVTAQLAGVWLKRPGSSRLPSQPAFTLLPAPVDPLLRRCRCICVTATCNQTCTAEAMGRSQTQTIAAAENVKKTCLRPREQLLKTPVISQCHGKIVLLHSTRHFKDCPLA